MEFVNLMGVNNSDNTELLQIFLEDARDGLTEWEKVCLNLTPADEAAAIGPILRCAHNLKGGAGLIGLNALHERLHRFEDHLTALRDQKVKFTPEVIDLLLKLENFFRNWIEKLKTDFDYNPDSTALEAALLQLTFKSGARDASAVAPI
jgi:two-component system chemotaxis sensor kinase CheA